MKTILFVFSLALTALSFAASRVPVAKDMIKFFGVHGPSISLCGVKLNPEVFGDLTTGRVWKERIVKLPASALSPWGIKKGDVIQVVEMKDCSSTKCDPKELLKTYDVKDHVWVLLKKIDDDMSDSKNGLYYDYISLILGDENYISKIKKDQPNESWAEWRSIYVSGIAYVGKDRKLQGSMKIPLSFDSLLPQTDPLYKELFRYAPPKKNEWIKYTTLMGHKILLKREIYAETKKEIEMAKARSTRIEDSIMFIYAKDNSLGYLGAQKDDDGDHSYYYDWISGSKVLVSRGSGEGNGGSINLYILSEAKAEKAEVYCDTTYIYQDKQDSE